MIAYFKLQNNLFMAAGAAIGFLLALAGYRGFIRPSAGYADVFVIALYVIIGVVAGRLLSSLWANRRVKKLTALLYRDGKPREFLDRFEPIVRKMPNNVVEYVDAGVKISYAYEGLGEFEKALQTVNALKPEELKLHMLAGTSLAENQRTRLYLLTEDTEQAQIHLGKLRELRDTAQVRAKALARNLGECVKLCENWLNFLRKEPYDSAYIQEEIDLAANRIHKSEMQLLLARMRHEEGKEEEARALLKGARESGAGLYGARRAGELEEAWS